LQGLPGGFGIPGRPGEPGAKVSHCLLRVTSYELGQVTALEEHMHAEQY